MPTVTYRGRWPTKRTPFGEFTRGIPQDREQDWLDANRVRLNNDPDFVVEGDVVVVEFPNTDDGPDSGWTRQQIYEWLTLHDVRARAGLTKAQLLKSVRGVLGIEDEVEEEAETPVPAEESMSVPVIEADETGYSNETEIEVNE